MKLFRAVLCATAFCVAASAATVTYTETVTTSGNLDGHAFTNSLVTLTLTGDTANVQAGGGNPFLQGTVNINVAGVGSDALLDLGEALIYPTGPYGGIFADSARVVFTINNAFASYALTTSIGPITGASSGYTGGAYNTASGGSFYLAGPFDVDHPSTFTATVQSVQTSTPEPGTWLLVFGGVAGAWAVRMLRSR